MGENPNHYTSMEGKGRGAGGDGAEGPTGEGVGRDGPKALRKFLRIDDLILVYIVYKVTYIFIRLYVIIR